MMIKLILMVLLTKYSGATETTEDPVSELKLKPIGANPDGSMDIPNYADVQEIDTDDARIPDILPIILLETNYPNTSYLRVTILNAQMKDEQSSRTFLLYSRMTSCSNIPSNLTCFFEECMLAIREETAPEQGSSRKAKLLASGCKEPRQEQKCMLCTNSTSCNARTYRYCPLPVEFKLNKVPACYTKFANVAGDHLAVEGGCTEVDVARYGNSQTEPSKGFSCSPEDELDYISRCTCVPEDFCNRIPHSSVDGQAEEKDPIVVEIKKSIRQLRADIMRMIAEVKERS